MRLRPPTASSSDLGVGTDSLHGLENGESASPAPSSEKPGAVRTATGADGRRRLEAGENGDARAGNGGERPVAWRLLMPTTTTIGELGSVENLRAFVRPLTKICSARWVGRDGKRQSPGRASVAVRRRSGAHVVARSVNVCAAWQPCGDSATGEPHLHDAVDVGECPWGEVLGSLQRNVALVGAGVAAKRGLDLCEDVHPRGLNLELAQQQLMVVQHVGRHLRAASKGCGLWAPPGRARARRRGRRGKGRGGGPEPVRQQPRTWFSCAQAP